MPPSSVKQPPNILGRPHWPAPFVPGAPSVLNRAALQPKAIQPAQRRQEPQVFRGVSPVFAQPPVLQRKVSPQTFVPQNKVPLPTRPAPVQMTMRRPGVIQKKPPLEGKPNNLGWTPGGSQIDPYVGASRLGVDGFNTTFRNKAIEEWKSRDLVVEQNLTKTDAILVARVHSTETGQPNWVPFAGTGIDHRRSTDQMGKDLRQMASQIEDEIKAGKFDWKSDWRREYYTIFRAASSEALSWNMSERNWKGIVEGIKVRYMVYPNTHGAVAYYHDFDNLEPMLSRENSSKGASGSSATVIPSATRLEVERATAKLYQDIMQVLGVNWGLKALNKQYIKGIVDNLQTLAGLFNTALAEDALATPQVASSGFNYNSPQRF